MSYDPRTTDEAPPNATFSTVPPSATCATGIPANPTPPPPTIHKRTYQACIPCRQRKVRCDLGSVEAPHDPPCVRCRRESKECYFSATRRKTRTPSTDEVGIGRGRGTIRGVVRKHEDDEEVLSPIKRSRSIGHGDFANSPSYSPSFAGKPFVTPIDPRLAERDGDVDSRDGDTATAAEALLQTPVCNSHQALLALVEVAGRDAPMSTGGKSPGDTDGEGEKDVDDSLSPATRNGVGVRFSSAGDGTFSPYARRRAGSNSTTSPGTQAGRPGTARSLSISTIHEDKDGLEKAAGWFTAREAIQYVEYFYKHLHPLSPTLTSPSLQHISHPSHHPSLLRLEPFLTTIILLITSRYMVLSGPGGQSRSYAIHDMLWREVRGGCEGLMWGGGWGGLGTASSNNHSYTHSAKVARGLRTLGTVEGLLILTEWHVRGLHFPMDVEEGDWMVDSSDSEECETTHTRRKARKGGGVVEGLSDRIENILEPAYRSDRMSWMLLGNALALAYELGVFDEIDEPASTTPAHLPSREPPPPDTGYRLRFQRIQKLLLLYVLQLASRLGWTSMIPRHITQSVQHKLNSAGASPASVTITGRWDSEDELQDVIFHSWVDLTMVMKHSAETLFPSRRHTKEIMRTGRYVELLEYFQPKLKDWKRDFDALNLPNPIHHILSMEYEHVRFYINSLALQAVVDRCTVNNSTKTAMMQVNAKDVSFIKEVVDASRALLSCVVKKMCPGGYLKHAPVRIYLRILGASMFLLKTLALGAKESDVTTSIDLIHDTIRALRSASVDDVHLALRFADLLEILTNRVNARFIRINPTSSATTNATADTSANTPPPQATSPKTKVRMLPPPTPGTLQADMARGDYGYDGADIHDAEFLFSGYEWLALPIDPVTGAGFDAGVTQSQMGVDVGGVDLLELLLAGSGGG
ncbi:unnamed protein product [Tuber melanosporum]|uniref:(Perigord truffle) hypothetical protein n=1 Tax=Tuber melanosporum (strain Mel28) TaxID=656061 RepID=D5G724_TUBMM|nr:uncharacterized protein GSTUM_00004569001 [Tuber melanosporum]CAZ80317.1 unnamed protein product [Tuber melanosporum]